jgi:hypothetical protein
VTGSDCIREVLVICTALIFVSDQDRNRGTGCFAFENPAQHFKCVRFFSLRDDAALPRPSPVELVLYEFNIEFQTSRASVNHTSHCGAV